MAKTPLAKYMTPTISVTRLKELTEDPAVDLNGKDEHGNTALIKAVQFMLPNAVKILITAGAVLNEKTAEGDTALMIAAKLKYAGSYSICLKLLRASASVTERNVDGLDALMLAILQEREDLAIRLIEAGADVNSSDKWGYRPVHLAVQKHLFEVVQVLAHEKADFDAPNQRGDTPLLMAAQSGHSDILTVCLNAKANINHQNRDGVTPLMAAVRHDNLGAAKRLLDCRDLDINAKDNDGNTAVSKCSADLAYLLLDHGVDVDASKDVSPSVRWADRFHKIVTGQKRQIEAVLSAAREHEAFGDNPTMETVAEALRFMPGSKRYKEAEARFDANKIA